MAQALGTRLFGVRLDTSFNFTADIVRVDGRPVAKVGRRYRPNPRLERVS